MIHFNLVNDNKGNVNYSSGQVVITDISPTALPNNVTDFRVTASVQEVAHNIKAERNQILVREGHAVEYFGGKR